MSVSTPFIISGFDIERSSLSAADKGKWAILVCGCFHLFASEAEAIRTRDMLLQDDLRTMSERSSHFLPPTTNHGV